MSLLTPLYILGALAIGLPILFHLIQRRPRGQQDFSSLMFLRPAPPRITRRSRLTNLLLLLLRALAILLLALAYARPFLPSFEQMLSDVPKRHVVVLLDTSASMRQQQLWPQAVESIKELVTSLSDTDRVALLTFDSQVRTRVGLAPPRDTATPIEAATQRKLILEAVEEIEPGWGTTNLGKALRQAAAAVESARSDDLGGTGMVVVVTDLQEGAELGELQGFAWPANLHVDVRRVASAPGNAVATVLPPIPGDDSESLRVRVSNDANSQSTDLAVAWQPVGGTQAATGFSGMPAERSRSIQVPAGQSRTLRVQRPSDHAQLVLSGDSQTFDNTTFVSASDPIERHLQYVGPTSAEAGSVFYFLGLAELGTKQRPVIIRATEPTEAVPTLEPQTTPLTVVNGLPTEEWAQALRPYLESGGKLLVVLDATELAASIAGADSNAPSVFETQPLAQLLGVDQLTIQSLTPNDDIVLTSIDFQSDLFAPFAAPGFSDFTKIRFQSFVEITTPNPPWKILARFDNNQAACLRQDVGDGCCWVLTSGWHKATSQLAMSTKFVPLLATMLGAGENQHAEAVLQVGEPVSLSGLAITEIFTPTGEVVPVVAGQLDDYRTTMPGLYQFNSNAQSFVRAVNVAASESRLAPLDVSTLESLNVPLQPYKSAETLEEESRQLKDVELESRQRIWRWLIVATLAILAIETYLGGRTPSVPSPQTAEV